MAETQPLSREVRLHSGVYEGVVENLIFKAHSGATSDLPHLIVGAELLLENARSKAVEEFSDRLVQRLATSGYLVADDIHDEARLWHMKEVDEEDGTA